MRATTWRCALASALLAAPAAAARGPWLVSISSTGLEACAQPGDEVVCRSSAGSPGEPLPYEVAGLTGTATLLPSSGAIRFVVTADTGKGGEAQWAVARQLEKSPASFWLHMGDIVYPRGDDEDYDAKHFAPYRAVLARMAFYPAIGNHDYGNHKVRRWLGRRSYETYRRLHRKPRWYSFDAGPAHVVCLDVNAAFGIREAAAIGAGSEQDRWLRADLAASRAPWKIVLLHVPVHATEDHGDHEALQEWLEPVFKEHGVQVVFQGHDHIYERTRPIDGTAYVTVGTGGAKLHAKHRGPMADPFVARLAEHGHLEVELDERALRARFLDAAGAERDAFELRSRAAD